MATVADYFDMPLAQLRLMVADNLAPVPERGSRRRRTVLVVRRMLLSPKTCGSMAWFAGIKQLDDCIDTPDVPRWADPALVVKDRRRRLEFVEQTTRVFGSIPAVYDPLCGLHDPVTTEALEAHAPLILAVREGTRLHRPVHDMLWELWVSFLPDAYRVLRGQVIPTEEVQTLAQHTNVLYGVGWAYLLGVPYHDAYVVMLWLTRHFFEVDNLSDLVEDVVEGDSHYTDERLMAAQIDTDLFVQIRGWDDAFGIDGLTELFHGIAADQVRLWAGYSRREMVKLFSKAPGPERFVYRVLAWVFATQQLVEAWQLERMSAAWLEVKPLSRWWLARNVVRCRALPVF